MKQSQVQPRVTLYVDSNGTHLHQVYTGLYLLAQSGKIALQLKRGHPLTKPRPNRQFITMRVKAEGKSSLCVFDNQDSRSLGLPQAVSQCDVYFKRSLESETYQELDASLHAKLKPFGLNYQVVASSKSMFVKRLVLECLSRPYNPLAAKNGFHVSNLKELFDVSWRGRRTFMLSQEELRPAAEVGGDSVMFQCRLWDPTQVAKRNKADTEEVNQQRIELVRALKMALGSNFIGGLQHNDYTKRVAPELMIDNPALAKRNEYIQLVRRAGVVISSPGLLGSNGWKLGEYVALGKCIVSEPIHTALPGRFSAGEHYALYDSTATCVERVLNLLADKARLAAYSTATAAYYETYLEPSRLMTNHIDTALSIAAS